jgi:hypothetical protein
MYTPQDEVGSVKAGGFGELYFCISFFGFVTFVALFLTEVDALY